MYKSRRVLLIAPTFNEEAKIGEVVRRAPRAIVDTVLVVDDCSTDRTAEVARAERKSFPTISGVAGGDSRFIASLPPACIPCSSR